MRLSLILITDYSRNYTFMFTFILLQHLIVIQSVNLWECQLLVSCIMSPIIFLVSTAFRFWENCRQETDRRTDGVQHFIAPIQVYFAGEAAQQECVLAAGASRCTNIMCNECYFCAIWTIIEQVWKILCSRKKIVVLNPVCKVAQRRPRILPTIFVMHNCLSNCLSSYSTRSCILGYLFSQFSKRLSRMTRFFYCRWHARDTLLVAFWLKLRLKHSALQRLLKSPTNT